MFLVLVAGLGALFGNVLVRGLGARQRLGRHRRGDPRGGRWPSCSCAPGAGRLLLQYLAVANVLFLVGFLFVSPVSALVSSKGDGGRRSGR